MDSISGIRDFGAHLQENAYHRALDIASSLQTGELLEVEVVEWAVEVRRHHAEVASSGDIYP